MPRNLHSHSISCLATLKFHDLIHTSCNLWDVYRKPELRLHRIYYGISIPFVIHSLDRSLSTRLIRWSARIEASPFY